MTATVGANERSVGDRVGRAASLLTAAVPERWRPDRDAALENRRAVGSSLLQLALGLFLLAPWSLHLAGLTSRGDAPVAGAGLVGLLVASGATARWLHAARRCENVSDPFLRLLDAALAAAGIGPAFARPGRSPLPHRVLAMQPAPGGGGCIVHVDRNPGWQVGQSIVLFGKPRRVAYLRRSPWLDDREVVAVGLRDVGTGREWTGPPSPWSGPGDSSTSPRFAQAPFRGRAPAPAGGSRFSNEARGA